MFFRLIADVFIENKIPPNVIVSPSLRALSSYFGFPILSRYRIDQIIDERRKTIEMEPKKRRISKSKVTPLDTTSVTNPPKLVDVAEFGTDVTQSGSVNHISQSTVSSVAVSHPSHQGIVQSVAVSHRPQPIVSSGVVSPIPQSTPTNANTRTASSEVTVTKSPILYSVNPVPLKEGTSSPTVHSVKQQIASTDFPNDTIQKTTTTDRSSDKTQNTVKSNKHARGRSRMKSTGHLVPPTKFSDDRLQRILSVVVNSNHSHRLFPMNPSDYIKRITSVVSDPNQRVASVAVSNRKLKEVVKDTSPSGHGQQVIK